MKVEMISRSTVIILEFLKLVTLPARLFFSEFDLYLGSLVNFDGNIKLSEK